MQTKTQVVLGMFVAAILMLGGASDVSAQQVYDMSELSTKPSIASPMAAQRAIQKAYPASLQSRGIEGKVVLSFVVTTSGKVDPSSIAVQSAEYDGLGDAATKAIADIEFVPGQVDGSAVSTRVVFPISFVAN